MSGTSVGTTDLRCLAGAEEGERASYPKARWTLEPLELGADLG